MANQNLQGKKVAILVTDGFEQDELFNRAKRWTRLALRPKLFP